MVMKGKEIRVHVSCSEHPWLTLQTPEKYHLLRHACLLLMKLLSLFAWQWFCHTRSLYPSLHVVCKSRKNFFTFSESLNFSRLRTKEQCQEVESAQQTIVLQGLFCPTSHSSILISRVAQSFWFTFHIFKEGSDLLCGYLFVRLEGIMRHPFFPSCTASWVPAEAPSEVGWRSRGTDVNHLFYLSLWMRLSHSGGRKVMDEFLGWNISPQLLLFSHLTWPLWEVLFSVSCLVWALLT